MGTNKILWLKIRAWAWGIVGSIAYRAGFETWACSLPWAVAWGYEDYIQYLEMDEAEKKRLGIDGAWKHQAEWTAADHEKYREKTRNEKPFVTIYLRRLDGVKHEGRPE